MYKLNRNICFLIFLGTTIFYILTRWLTFKGFNGSDDLHYAMLAARMVNGTYNPFQPGDIFSGRILLITSQAAIYKIAGIHTWTTQAGSIIVIIAACYLVTFNLLQVKKPATTLLAVCLFYFNPVLTYFRFGILPDVYIMLAGIIITILLRACIIDDRPGKKNIITGILIGFITALSLLYKETIIVFLPFVCLVSFFYNRINAKPLILSLISTFLLMLLIYACIYYYYTGNALFKITQIKNSSYINQCSYNVLPIKYLAIRLTYGLWQDFTIEGFYPVIFGALISIMEIYRRRNIRSKQNVFPVFMLTLLVLCLYFPFSLQGYQPLCSDARQYLLLLPPAVLVTTNYIEGQIECKTSKYTFFFLSLIVLATCVISTGNKWQWLIYLLICFWSIIEFSWRKLPRTLKYMALAGILWLSIVEHLFFKNSNWFHDMVSLNKQITSKYYYFPDHDNMMHWELLHHFDNETFAFYNLEKYPFKIFKIYYQNIDADSFHPGWLIINKAYTARSTAFLKGIDSLEKKQYFSRQIIVGDMSAYMIKSAESLTYIKSLIHKDEK